MWVNCSFCRKQNLQNANNNTHGYKHQHIHSSMIDTASRRTKLKPWQVIVSNVVLWAKYIIAKRKKDVAVEHKRDGIYPQNPFFPHLQRLSNVSFLNSSISRWLLNTFCDLSTTTKKSRRTKSFFSPQDEACKKTLTVSSIILFSICISFYFQPLFNL